MSLWLALAVLLIFSAIFLAIPFLRAVPGGGRSTSNAAAALKALLGDINRAEAMGDIDAQSAQSERTSVQRQLLAASTTTDATPPERKQVDRLTAISILAVIILGAVALYAVTLAPSAEDMQNGVASAPAMPQAATQKKLLPDVDTMITRLADRMKKTPKDVDGWRMLGWSYFETQHFAQAVDAYAHAVTLKPNSAALQSAYGEALAEASGGTVTPAAAAAFYAALTGDPKDERARYYTAMGQKQAGNSRAALDAWIAELNEAAPTSLWAARLRTQITATAQELHVDVSRRLPAPQSVPAPDFAKLPAASAQQMAGLPPQEQQQMIAGMVEGLDQRLKTNPKDAEGWVRLIRSRKVLGQVDLARTALSRALTAFNGDDSTQARIKAAALDLGVSAN